MEQCQNCAIVKRSLFAPYPRKHLCLSLMHALRDRAVPDEITFRQFKTARGLQSKAVVRVLDHSLE